MWAACSADIRLISDQNGLPSGYLGIIIDSELMQVSLPVDKFLKIQEVLKTVDENSMVTIQQMRRIAGHLEHGSKVLWGVGG